MTKAKKPIAQEPAPKPALKTYAVETEYGTMYAIRHTFNGRTYVQMELDTPKLEAIGELLIESDIFSAVRSDPSGLTVDPGLVVSHLIRKRLVKQFLVLVLRHDDGTMPVETEFNGKASEFMSFTSEVFDGFFLLNPDVLATIGQLLITVLGAAAGGGQLIGMFLAGANSSGPRASTDPKAKR